MSFFPAQKFGTTSSGFTIIELVVVFAVIAILGTVGVASFVNYNNSQKIINATQDLKTFMVSARSLATSQKIVGTACYGTSLTLDGYEVDMCCPSAGSGCNCVSDANKDYQMLISCGGNSFVVDSKKLPSGIVVNNASTTSRSYYFKTVTGGVNGAGSVSLIDQTTNQTKTISVSSTGIIQ